MYSLHKRAERVAWYSPVFHEVFTLLHLLGRRGHMWSHMCLHSCVVVEKWRHICPVTRTCCAKNSPQRQMSQQRQWWNKQGDICAAELVRKQIFTDPNSVTAVTVKGAKTLKWVNGVYCWHTASSPVAGQAPLPKQSMSDYHQLETMTFLLAQPWFRLRSSHIDQ